MQNELAEAYPSQNPATDQMAAQGRKGDAMMAHVTPGDYVIPKDILVQHPDFLVKLKKVMSDENEDYRTHMVGSGFENINPETGAAEFGFGSIKRFARSLGAPVGSAVGKLLPAAGDRAIAKTAPTFGLLGTGSLLGREFGKGVAQGVTTPQQSGGGGGATPYSPSEMKLPGSLQELSGLTDQQRRSYLATQGSQGEGLGGNARDYYVNLLQRNIQANPNQALLPVESQYLSQSGVNNNLSGQALVDALRGF